MIRNILLVFVLTVLASSQAAAQTRDWSGYWLGFGVGASRGHYDVSDGFCITSADAIGDAGAAAACAVGDGGVATAVATSAEGATATATASTPPPFTTTVTVVPPGGSASAAAVASETFAISAVSADNAGSIGEALAAGVVGNFDPDEDNSVALGVNTRYDYQYPNNFVLGLELDYIASPSSGFSSRYSEGGFIARQSASIDANIASARIRLGHAFGDTLTYLTGGVALGHFDADLRSSISSSSFDDISSSESASTTAVGGVIGGGMSFWLPDNAVLSAEVLYYMFDDEIDFGNASSTSVAGNASAAASPGFRRSIGIGNSLTAMIKLSFKFQ